MSMILLASIFALALCAYKIFIYSELSLVYPAFIVLSSIYTIIGGYYYDFALDLPFNFHIGLSQEDWAFMAAALLYASLIYILFNYFSNILFNNKSGPKRLKYRMPINLEARHHVSIFIVFFVILHLGYGGSALYSRTGYEIGHAGSNVARQILLLVVPALAFSISLYKSQISRFAFIMIGFIFLLGTGSRIYLVLPAFFMFGRIFLSDQPAKADAIIALVLITLGLGTFFDLRYSTQQGVFHNFSTVFFDSGFDGFVAGVNYLLSYSFFASYETQRILTTNTMFLFESLAPIPGSMLDLSPMIVSQRLNVASPFTAVGILFGNIYLLTVSFAFLGFFWGWVFSVQSRVGTVWRILVLCCYLAFIVLSLQYNLRGTSRFIYLSFFILLCGHLAGRLKLRRLLHRKFSRSLI